MTERSNIEGFSGMDEHGWVNVSELIEAVYARGYTIDSAVLKDVVDVDSKNRFSFNENGVWLTDYVDPKYITKHVDARC